MRVAAQTRILSSRWKHIWNSYPVFDFCQNSLFNVDSHRLAGWELDDGISKQVRPQYWETLEKLTNIVDQKLEKFSECKLGIQKFKLSIALADQEFHSFVDKWMEVVSEKHVKELDLCIRAEGKFGYVLPQTIFAAKYLTVLKIRGYNLMLEDPVMKSAVDLHSLQILSLENVYIDEKTTQNLISSCPFVEDLYRSFNEGNSQSLKVYGLVKLVNLTVNMRSDSHLM
ncbi:hypothetical protein SLEP1_g49218 [Rubroshorea leprosula]|uniref:F-box/LRR-repeat protein 15/At3g58940/PEG3-like LRR domain-containing protein n=1 Tax=Rubroshorea leprosula TaxID=152421 RepID=A0AAV5LW45_9ROSI|nr:hypothetical protein SLEP1_g49218 [Rubroshorea leprosula]